MLLQQTIICNNFTLDTSFNNPDGYTYLNSGITYANSYGISYAIDSQPDQKIVIAGSANVQNHLNNNVVQTAATLACYTPEGIIDTSFNSTGYVTMILGNFAQFYGVVIQADGKIVAIGSAKSSSHYSSYYSSILIARYNQNGSLDTSFNNLGYVLHDYEGTANDVALQSDGKIMIIASSNNTIIVNRYNIDGSVDSTFGTSGKASVITGSGITMKLQSDGKIVGAGTSSNGSVLFRLNVDGSLDSSFGTNGLSQLYLGYSINIKALTLDQQNRIILGGEHKATSGSSARSALVVRYNTNGSLDTSFNQTGYVITPISSCDILCSYDIIINFDTQNNQPYTIFFIGSYGNTTTIIISYNQNGYLNTSFNSVGYQTIKIKSRPTIAYAAKTQNTNELLITGKYDDSITRDGLLIMRLFNDTKSTPTNPLINLYGSQSTLFSNFLYHEFYAQIITNATARNYAIETINLILSSYSDSYKNQQDFNYIAYFYLLSSDLAQAKINIIAAHPTSLSQINQLFRYLEKRIIQLKS